MYSNRTRKILQLVRQNPGEIVTESIPSTSLMEPTSSTSRLEPIPSTSRMGPIPSTSRMEPIPSTSRMEPIPSTSRMEPIPSTSRMEPIPSTSHMDILNSCPIMHYQEPINDYEMELCPLTGEFVFKESIPDTLPNTYPAIQQENLHQDNGDMELCPATGEFVNKRTRYDDIQVDNRVLCEVTGNYIPNNVQDVSNLNDPDITVTQKIKKKQKRRTLGKEYIGYKKENGKYVQDEVKPAKKMHTRCKHKPPKVISKNSSGCSNITEEDRLNFFKNFWSLKSWPEKKAYFLGLVSFRGIKKRRSQSANNSKKMHGHDIFLVAKNGQKHRVCRCMFINTIGISKSTFTRWCNEHISYVPPGTACDEEENIPPPNKRTTKTNDNIGNIKRWLNSLPLVESHYCRSKTTRRYVDESFLSILHMLSVYNSWCISENLPKVNRNFFTQVLKDEKVSIHHPRKDQCDICVARKCGTVDQSKYDAHMIRKEQAKEAKKNAKEAANEATLVLTMDLQSVLLCPKLLASAVYYRQKLQVHNFTIYELNNANVTLYTWHEADGGVSANEFSSCIIDFLNKLPPNYTKVILISDGCNYQNRNRVLASALSDHAKKSGLTIEQIFLEKGHTMMEADNVHSVLEHYFKPPIYSSSDYISRMQMARPKQPYCINHVHYDFFKGYENLRTTLPSLRPGKKSGDPVVNDLRMLQYLPSGSILYKIDHSGDLIDLPQRRKNGDAVLLPLYTAPLPISEGKFNHLQELKSVIDLDHHPFYDSLTHS